MITLAGRCGVVTNATSSIGRAVALELARDGARVALGYHGYRGADFEAVERLVREILRVGGEALPLRLPVDGDSECKQEQVVGRLVQHWGWLDYVVDLDNQCPFGRAALRWMLERRRGRIVHICPSGVSAIRLTRADLRALTAHGITINMINVSARSAVRPEDIAATVLFLLGQECFLTGQVIDLSDAVGKRQREVLRRRQWIQSRLHHSAFISTRARDSLLRTQQPPYVT